jgi:hypothetical protein
VLLLLGLAITPVAAASNTVSGSVTQSYNAGASVLPSMFVEFESKDKTSVKPLDSTDISNMLGVVVPSSNATIVLSPQNVTSQQVLVASSGSYDALVSTQNGPIKTGDYLTISALPGVAMKADSNQTLVVGRAVDNFNGTNAISSVSLKNLQNKAINVSIGRIAVNIQLAPSPLYLKSKNTILVFLTRAEYDVTNKAVSPPRTYLCGLVFLGTILITIIVLYTGTRSALIAIGRNPLAKRPISMSLLKTIFAGVLVFATGTAGVYLILSG